jgi:hypothetical protein
MEFVCMSKAPLATDDSLPVTFGWLQMEKKVGQELQKLAIKHPAAMGTLLYLITNMGRNNALAVSQSVMAEKVGIGRQAVSVAVKLLAEHRFIEIVKVSNLCIYRVNTRVAWQGNRGARFAHFMADVIAVESEQQGRGIDNDMPLKKLPVLDSGERIFVGNEPIDPPDQQELELP